MLKIGAMVDADSIKIDVLIGDEVVVSQTLNRKGASTFKGDRPAAQVDAEFCNVFGPEAGLDLLEALSYMDLSPVAQFLKDSRL
jgi:hypothetical protein